MLTDSSRVTRWTGRAGTPPHVALTPGPCRAEQVEADAAGDLRQPGAGGCDGFPLLADHPGTRPDLAYVGTHTPVLGRDSLACGEQQCRPPNSGERRVGCRLDVAVDLRRVWAFEHALGEHDHGQVL